MLPNQVFTSVTKSLASTELAIALFGAVCLFAIPGTFSESREMYSNPLFLALLGALALNLVFCTWKRWRALAKSTLIMHGGVLLTLAGCVFTSFGYVATINIHEGSSVTTAYRWDKKQDVPLGMEIAVQRINREYYPVPIQVGVLRGTEKYKLFTLKTGDEFVLDEYRVVASVFEPVTQNLKLAVFRKDQLIGKVDTEGVGDLPSGFPYSFKLVAYKNPVLKRGWVDLQLSDKGKILAKGTAEVNGPFFWNGLHFYNTLAGKDEKGMSYAGIQIVKDPGRPYVFVGFAVMSLGAVLAFIRRFFPAR